MNTMTVVASSSLLRAGVVSLLRSLGFQPIEEMDALKELQEPSDHASPERIVVHLLTPEEQIAATVAKFMARASNAKLVFVAPILDIEIMSVCFAAGADGYLLQNISREGLRESLKLVEAGEKVFPTELATVFPKLMNNCLICQGEHAQPNGVFSPREAEILRGLVGGQSNKMIAKNLDIAEATVKVYVKRILRKANVANRTQAALWGAAGGFKADPAGRRLDNRIPLMPDMIPGGILSSTDGST